MRNQAENGRAADNVVAILAQRIQTGELGDGQPLPPERDMMEEFGISRTVVREAVVALSNKGLIEARPRHRPLVRKPGYDSAFSAIESIVTHLLHQPGGVRNLFDTRILLEAALVREAAKTADKHDISALKQALEANEASIDNSEMFYETDIGFHRILYEIPRNPVLPAVNRAYTTWLAPHWMQMPRLPDRNQKNFKAHKEIFDAVLMRDPDAAEDALKRHLENAWDQVRQTFGEI
ncbi:FCD domain-containing protein [Ruegeria meonggei]|uniref:Putative HTH-type transcriptional regulator YdfH n=1 Tax=Ruegeria meonggei TaxID=1446476 RepID=A0A1X6ZJM6_9RHOB|nr:FCD domain-containing protein [Ruegeria meonggei]SLN53005.1 putative HTH-type transcriptional regulator YdfH [Ruegeria meonggei]